MNILPISVNYQQNFKSTYPVVHWVAETNGSYAPVANLKLVKNLQSKIVRILNKPLAETTKNMSVVQQKLRAYIGGCDIDYRRIPKVRSFYNRTVGSINDFTPVSYIISGKDVAEFEDLHAKNIGRRKGSAAGSSAVAAAIKEYNREGLNYVNNEPSRIKDKNGLTYVLHTKFEIIRNKVGKIKDFKFIDARFLPEYGPECPFEKLKK